MEPTGGLAKDSVPAPKLNHKNPTVLRGNVT